MNPQRILIVGGVAGGASAAARARRLSEAAAIVVFERGPHVSFANCGLPYHVGGEIPKRDSLFLNSPESLRARFNLDVRTETEVLSLQRDRKEIHVRHLPSARESFERYDALILSPGASPVRPPLPGIDRPGNFAVRNVPDIDRIQAWIQSGPTNRAVVVGGGYIGLEMTEQLKRRGLAVSLVEALPQAMAPLDPEMAAWLHQELRAQGVELYLGDAVAGFDAPAANEAARASTVVLRSGRRLPADLVILGLGVKPEVALARAAGLEIGALGGIRVNERLQTSDPNIYAIGDAIEVRDRVTDAWSLIPLAGPANRQGRIVADNLLGQPARYAGTLGTAVLRLFTLTAASTGANERSLRKAGIAFHAVHLHPLSHASYYPGASPVALKLLFAPKTGRLLGAQAVGKEGVEKRIDVLATAIQAAMTVDDLVDLELSYAPPYSSAKDPVNLAGMAAQNALRGCVQLASWSEIAGLDPARSLILDVRNEDECRQGTIPNSVHIPLPQLRKRIGELSRDRDIVVHCQSGQRSYFACRFLSQNGYRVRNLTGSWRTWKTATTP